MNMRLRFSPPHLYITDEYHHHYHNVIPTTDHAFLQGIALRMIESPPHLDVALSDLAMQAIHTVYQ